MSAVGFLKILKTQ